MSDRETDMQTPAAASKEQRNESVKVRTGVKGGGQTMQHNPAVKVRTGVKGGALSTNHSPVLQARTGVKAGAPSQNHNLAVKVQNTRNLLLRRIAVAAVAGLFAVVAGLGMAAPADASQEMREFNLRSNVMKTRHSASP